MPLNPFSWHSSAKQVNSDVVGMSIYGEDGETKRLRNLTKPVVVTLPRKFGQYILCRCRILLQRNDEC